MVSGKSVCPFPDVIVTLEQIEASGLVDRPIVDQKMVRHQTVGLAPTGPHVVEPPR